MKNIVTFGIFILLVACQNKVSEEELSPLNGYWEIEKVTMANGQTREYKVNTVVDYIEVRESSGFRKKVYPKFDGTFDTSNDAEKFSIVQKKNKFELHYKTKLSEWIEVLESLGNDSFTVTNTENITYDYKRFEPVDATD